MPNLLSTLDSYPFIGMESRDGRRKGREHSVESIAPPQGSPFFLSFGCPPLLFPSIAPLYCGSNYSSRLAFYRSRTASPSPSRARACEMKTRLSDTHLLVVHPHFFEMWCGRLARNSWKPYFRDLSPHDINL